MLNCVPKTLTIVGIHFASPALTKYLTSFQKFSIFPSLFLNKRMTVVKNRIQRITYEDEYAQATLSADVSTNNKMNKIGNLPIELIKYGKINFLEFNDEIKILTMIFINPFARTTVIINGVNFSSISTNSRMFTMGFRTIIKIPAEVMTLKKIADHENCLNFSQFLSANALPKNPLSDILVSNPEIVPSTKEKDVITTTIPITSEFVILATIIQKKKVKPAGIISAIYTEIIFFETEFTNQNLIDITRCIVITEKKLLKKSIFIN